MFDPTVMRETCSGVGVVGVVGGRDPGCCGHGHGHPSSSSPNVSYAWMYRVFKIWRTRSCNTVFFSRTFDFDSFAQSASQASCRLQKSSSFSADVPVNSFFGFNVSGVGRMYLLLDDISHSLILFACLLQINRTTLSVS